ncbi:MAG TPA: MBL fold metallo-hydrolase [Nevskiaceae bacterium]|nr:MBL fold metallo-hydrolase [Nevskiaceae bacterium]
MARYEKLNDGIVCIDTEQHRPGMAACYLFGNDGHYAFVECGTSLSVPSILQVLTDLDVPRGAVDYVMPTHVHLDHAGGAGALLRELPNARLVVHPRGARHLIDPTRLIASTIAVYGEQKAREYYGEIVPVPEGRVIIADVAADHDFAIKLGQRPLTFIDAPGHARHHYAIWDSQSRGWFTGDVFGVSYRDFDSAHGPYLLPTTTPTQLDPEAWNNTLDRLLAKTPAHMYLTHYGRVDSPQKLAPMLRAGLAAYQRIARRHADDAQRQAHIISDLHDYHLHQLREMHHPLPEPRIEQLLKMDLSLNAQGLEVWLARQHKPAAVMA